MEDLLVVCILIAIMVAIPLVIGVISKKLLKAD